MVIDNIYIAFGHHINNREEYVLSSILMTSGITKQAGKPVKIGCNRATPLVVVSPAML